VAETAFQLPETLEEWRSAAQSAAGLQLIEAARIYGFIDGGPKINLDRVDEILELARNRGIVPTTEEAQQAALILIAELHVADTER
jgi:hypothetical protein